MSGLVFNMMRFSLHDGPGIRTTVFLKGCPLSCWWCHNPESQARKPSPMHLENRCRLCGDCVGACPCRAISIEGGVVRTSARCRRCGACVEACMAGARQVAGKRMTVSEVLREVERDIVFFDESGGGVTLSGGEPLAQPVFAEALLAACRERRIHTALDTSGFAPRDVVLRAGELAGLVLYDLKLAGAAAHEQATGVSNDLILSNLEALVEAGRNVIVRVPLIPGVTDVMAIAGVVRRLGLRRIDLLPYHNIGIDKYNQLGMKRRDAVEPPSPEEVNRIAGELTASGFEVRIGG